MTRIPTHQPARHHQRSILPTWRLPHAITIDGVAGAILLLGLIHGLALLFLVPPWEHYDEPTHFEYAWLIANRGTLPQPGDVDYTMRREVAASMMTQGFYARRDMAPPNLLTDSGDIWIGYSELVHPPAYYLLVSIPVWITRYLEIETQLYAARCASLLLYLLTIGIALRLMRDLASPGNTLRWAVPLSLTMLPPFVDLMTAVNNDVGAVFVLSLFLWLAVRLIRFGITWRRCALLIGVTLLAVATKNTAAVAVVLAPLALVIALWRQQQWRWRWLSLGAIAGTLALRVIIFDWGDAAYWYRWTSGAAQATPTRAIHEQAPLGSTAIRLEASSGATHALINPLLSADIAQLRGREVTVGGWIWASQPITTTAPTLIGSPQGRANARLSQEPLALTTAPQFFAQTIEVPDDTVALAYLLEAPATPAADRPVVYLDGALVVEGAYAAATPPEFFDADGRQGHWNGQHITNRLRNGSAESAWLRLRPWLEQALLGYIRHSPAQTISALMDIERVGRFMLTTVAHRLFVSTFGVFGWGGIALDPAWQWTFATAAGIALLGAGKWMFWQRQTSGAVATVLFLGLAGLLVWSNTLLRALPLLDGNVFIPVARYAFPAVLPLMLLIVGGWWALPPQRWQRLGVLIFISYLVVLWLVSLATLWTIYDG